MKKQLLTLLLSVFACGAMAQTATWISQASGFIPVSSGVRYISPVDTNVLWICAYDGSGGGADRQDFSRTIDGGALWASGTIPVPTTYDWSMIEGVSADSAFAVFYDAAAGSGGGIWRTADGGNTWTQCGAGSIFNANSFPNVVHFWNAQEGFAMGDPNGGYFEIYTTSDGGDNWTRVPQANIPAPTSGEYGIVGHYNVIGDNIYFDTNKGRVYHSHDRGQTWSVGSTGITVPTTIGAIDICFYSPANGIARLYNAGVNTVKVTADSGNTWSALTVTGNFWGSDVKYVPGTVSKMVSTGAATGLSGSSYSDDGGANWIDIETGTQRTALGVVDSMNMWCGGFTSSPTADGIFRYTVIPAITCGDSNINPGTITASDTIVCDGDTLTLTTSGIYAPTVGDFAGVSWIISSGDITGSAAPLNEPTLVGTYTFVFPAPSSVTLNFINDGNLIGNGPPYGIYYWTPVVFGNATGISPAGLGDLTLDPLCTYVGQSVPVYIAEPLDTLCSGGTNGIASLNSSNLGISAFQSASNAVQVRLQSVNSGMVTIQLLDLTGRVVYTSEKQLLAVGLNTIQIDATLSSGTYLVKAEMNGAVASTKFVKQ